MNEIQFRSPRHQRGLTLISWMVVIGVAVFFVIMGMKLVPIYLENYSVKTILKSVEEDRGSAQRSPREIRDGIMKRLKINGVYDFDPAVIKIKKDKGRTQINVDYDVRKNMVGNIDVIVSFQEKAVF